MSTHGGGSGGRARGAESAGQGRTVSYTEERYRAFLMRMAGQDLSAAEVANLAGAQPGAQVSVGMGGQITVREADGSMHQASLSPVGMRRHLGGRGILEGHYIDAHGNAGASYALPMLATQVRQAQALGFDYIHVQARSGSRDVIELPQMGFDAPIDANLMQEMTRTNAQVRPPVSVARVSDALTTSAGTAWWLANAANPSLSLDLAPGSQSIQTFNAYLIAHGMNPV